MKRDERNDGAATRPSDDRGLLVRALIRYVIGVVVCGAMLFGPAGAFSFWPAWIYCGVLFGPMLFMVFYLYRNDPALLERRMRRRERERSQRRIIAVFNVVFLVGFLLPGFDYRFGWSEVPVAVILISNGVVLAGYLLFFFVLRANSFAARTVDVEHGQELISTGPYAWVRHPMYTAVTLIFLLTPTALGSWWAVPAFLPVLPLLYLRIRDEERVLRDELGGYAEYCEAVRYRMIPGVW